MEYVEASRPVLAEDSVVLRDGVVELLGARGCEVVATAGTAPGLLAAVVEHRPDVAVVDIRMPPTRTDDGIRAAVEIRARTPEVGIVVFSQHVETTWASRLLADGAAGIGYLLKERVARTCEFVDALYRIADGGTALDPEIVTQLMRGGQRGRVDTLTPREREVLEKHVAAVFSKQGGVGRPTGAGVEGADPGARTAVVQAVGSCAIRAARESCS
ncbi:response regulator transcription factor [Streptomyces flaveolus]|uniref:response regulator n=1 Tax=Streptomyces flaveolus TaxID=67297 RepID=UPI0033B8DE3B